MIAAGDGPVSLHLWSIDQDDRTLLLLIDLDPNGDLDWFLVVEVGGGDSAWICCDLERILIREDTHKLSII